MAASRCVLLVMVVICTYSTAQGVARLTRDIREVKCENKKRLQIIRACFVLQSSQSADRDCDFHCKGGHSELCRMNTSGEERCCRLFSERDVDDLNAALLNHSGKYNLTHLPETFEERGSYIIKYLCLTGSEVNPCRGHQQPEIHGLFTSILVLPSAGQCTKLCNLTLTPATLLHVPSGPRPLSPVAGQAEDARYTWKLTSTDHTGDRPVAGYRVTDPGPWTPFHTTTTSSRLALATNVTQLELLIHLPNTSSFEELWLYLGGRNFSLSCETVTKDVVSQLQAVVNKLETVTSNISYSSGDQSDLVDWPVEYIAVPVSFLIIAGMALYCYCTNRRQSDDVMSSSLPTTQTSIPMSPTSYAGEATAPKDGTAQATMDVAPTPGASQSAEDGAAAQLLPASAGDPSQSGHLGCDGREDTRLKVAKRDDLLMGGGDQYGRLAFGDREKDRAAEEGGNVYNATVMTGSDDTYHDVRRGESRRREVVDNVYDSVSPR